MQSENCLHGLRQVRERMSVLERAAMRPTADLWLRCAPELEEATSLLSELESSLADSAAQFDLEERASLRRELTALRRDIAHVNTLLASAADLYRGMAELSGLALSGYAADGRVLSIAGRPQLCVQG